jgi:hypothetical protein
LDVGRSTWANETLCVQRNPVREGFRSLHVPSSGSQRGQQKRPAAGNERPVWPRVDRDVAGWGEDDTTAAVTRFAETFDQIAKRIEAAIGPQQDEPDLRRGDEFGRRRRGCPRRLGVPPGRAAATYRRWTLAAIALSWTGCLRRSPAVGARSGPRLLPGPGPVRQARRLRRRCAVLSGRP